MSNKLNSSIKLMTHVVIGYPSLEATVELVKTMAEAGVDIVELQIPFSDPLADGPTIMKACEKSLENGTRVRDAFSIMCEISEYLTKKSVILMQGAQDDTVGLYFMSYFNTIFKYGVEKFCKDAKKAGASGLIVPDIPLEEEPQEHYIEACKKYHLNNIRIISPSSTQERLQKNAKIASGFVYFTSRQGITGASTNLDPNLIGNIARVKKYFKIPVAVGFGISKKEHIQALAGHADIAVVGSAIIDIINKSDKENMIENVRNFIHKLKMVE